MTCNVTVRIILGGGGSHWGSLWFPFIFPFKMFCYFGSTIEYNTPRAWSILYAKTDPPRISVAIVPVQWWKSNWWFSLFPLFRKHAASVKCFYQMSAAFCRTSGSTSTSLLTSAPSVAPAAVLSISNPTSQRTACITRAGLATGQSTMTTS